MAPSTAAGVGALDGGRWWRPRRRQVVEEEEEEEEEGVPTLGQHSSILFLLFSVHPDRPQRQVCKEEEEEFPDDQRLCNQEMDSSMDQKDPEPPQVKEEQEEHYISQEGEQLVLNQETDASMLTPTCDENDPSEDQTVYMKPEPPEMKEEQEESVFNMPVIVSVVGAAEHDQLLLSNCSHISVCHDSRLFVS